MLVFTQFERVDRGTRADLADRPPAPGFQLSLTAEDRAKVRRSVILDDGSEAWLQLARGTALRPGDRLQTATGEICEILAKPEPVLTVRSPDRLALLQAAYHLGNRHAPLEIAIDYLRLEPDPTLKALLDRRGLQVIAEIAPFVPESGAYADDRSDAHSHSHAHSH